MPCQPIQIEIRQGDDRGCRKHLQEGRQSVAVDGDGAACRRSRSRGLRQRSSAEHAATAVHALAVVFVEPQSIAAAAFPALAQPSAVIVPFATLAAVFAEPQSVAAATLPKRYAVAAIAIVAAAKPTDAAIVQPRRGIRIA